MSRLQTATESHNRDKVSERQLKVCIPIHRYEGGSSWEWDYVGMRVGSVGNGTRYEGVGAVGNGTRYEGGSCWEWG